ncbi:hypothetical protein V2G26_016312 [Clonostachys chloroleuca]
MQDGPTNESWVLAPLTESLSGRRNLLLAAPRISNQGPPLVPNQRHPTFQAFGDKCRENYGGPMQSRVLSTRIWTHLPFGLERS